MALVRSQALLIDLTRCIGCGACVETCLTEHGLDTDPATVTGLSSRALTALVEQDGVWVRQLCRHCLTPACASVCPVEAFRKTPEGPVTYDASRCLGCRYCMQACPFGVPRYQWDAAVPAVVKCDFCAARQAAGRPTACAEVCPAEATVYGSREELLAEARRRIADDPGAYFPHVYGETEGGGTSVLFLSPVAFESLGFPALAGEPLPELTAKALEKIPGILSIGGVMLAGIWWITQRREEVARAAYEAKAAAAREEGRHDRA
jgi:formate dehydrogenase iron-sulfur subunit